MNLFEKPIFGDFEPVKYMGYAQFPTSKAIHVYFMHLEMSIEACCRIQKYSWQGWIVKVAHKKIPYPGKEMSSIPFQTLQEQFLNMLLKWGMPGIFLLFLSAYKPSIMWATIYLESQVKPTT